MSEWMLLLLLIAFLWLGESVLWLRHDSEAIVRTWKGMAPARRAAANRGNLSSSLIWASTVPAGYDFLCGEWPGGLLNRDYLYTLDRGSALETATDWERHDWRTITSVEQWSNTITLNGSREIQFGTVTLAREIRRIILSCQSAPPEDRSHVIDDAMRRAFDDDAIEVEWKRFRRFTRLPSILSGILFMVVFVVLPVLAIWIGASNVGIEMVGVVLLLDLLVACAFAVAHRARCRLTDRTLDDVADHARITGDGNECSQASSPSGLRPLPSGCGAHRLASHDDAARFVRSRWWSGDGRPMEAVWTMAREASGLRREVKPRSRAESRSETYCPRCEIRYVITAGICNDCRIGLVPFES